MSFSLFIRRTFFFPLLLLLVLFLPRLLLAAPLTVKLADHVTEAGLAGVELHAYERAADGTETWRAKRTTDGEGIALFDLEGLGAGRNYVVKGQPFGLVVSSALIGETGWYGFRVGKLQVQVMDGATGQPKVGTSVVLKRWSDDGNHVPVLAAVTDSSGWIKVDPPAVGSEAYVVVATSPTDGQQKVSEKLWTKGPHRFVLGNPAVAVTLQDGVSGAGLAGQWVEVWEKVSETQKVYRLKRWTDSAGQVKFDLDGLAEGRRYLLKAQPYQQAVESGTIAAAGATVFKVGVLQVQLLDGRNGQAYAWRDVTLQQVATDGSLVWAGRYRTDGEGRVKLDPPELGAKSYVLQAPSLMDGKTKTSPVYAAAGSQVFRVGSAGLVIKLIDHVTDTGIPGVELHAYERAADGTDTWRATATTDSGGLAPFDLDGLGSGRSYVIKGKPFQAWVSSEVQTATGWYGFRVGKLQVQVMDGATGQPKVGASVSLKRWSDDGNHVPVLAAVTDSSGWIKVDPPALGSEAYVVVATSPTDGQQKVSEKLWNKGPHRFVLGNPAVAVTLQDGVSGAGLAGQWVEVWEKVSETQKAYRLKRMTDSAGQVKFDLDGLAEGRRYLLRAQPYQQAVESDEIAAAGARVLKAGALQVRVLDGRNGQSYALREVTLLQVGDDGSSTWVAVYQTDADGRVKLDPADLGAKRYVLKAASLLDGSTKTSDTYASGGSYTFRVGNAGLTVKLADHVTEAGLAGVELHAYERAADGTETWRAKRTTDGEGIALFDLEGLGSGRNYVVKGQPFGLVVSSALIGETGWYGFRVGKLQVQVMDGATGQPKAGASVSLKRWSDDGNHVPVLAAVTDSSGWIKVDPPAVGSEAYVVVATSPTDGQQKVSEKLWTKGPHRFVLGNPAVAVTLQDGVSGAGLAGQWVEVWEKVSETQKVYRLKRWTDSAGQVKFDLDGLTEGRRYLLKAQPYQQVVESGTIAAAGATVFKVGVLQVQLLDGRNGQAYAWRDVTLQQVATDGSLVWAGAYRTDGDGRVKLDPPELGAKRYALRAASLLDGSQKTSESYAAGGSYTFRVGSAGLTVKLIDHLTDSAMAGVELHAYERAADGTDTWRAMATTDSSGLSFFDLEGLGSGRNYVIKGKPFHAWVSSDLQTTTGWYGFRVGTLPVTVVDLESQQLLNGVTVVAYEKRPDGALIWSQKAVTDAGGVIRFDLDGLGTGREYVLQAQNPYADGNNHFSTVLAWRGAFRFELSQGEREEVDVTPPIISILEPAATPVKISSGGLRINGTASDEKGIREVRLTMTLPSGAVLDKAATWRAASGSWFVHTGAIDSAPGTIRAVLRAIDLSYNEAETSIDLTLIKDTTPPVLTVQSHADGSTVPTGGFLVSGLISDDTVGSGMRVTLSGGGMSTALVADVEVAQSSGRWVAVLTPEDRFNGALMLTLLATDSAGNQTSRSLNLTPSDQYAQAWHLLQRTSFGPHPATYADVSRSGVSAALQAQLAMAAGADEGYMSAAGGLAAGTQVATDFVRHAIYGDQELREVMTWFWDNHFNTNYNTHSNSQFERDENDAFRLHAFGNFRVLLGASAHSPAMLYTLDGRSNMKYRPNENYARELMELHTLGVDGGYTQADVEEVARAFTGWTVIDGAFSFNAALHDTGAKTVLATTIAAGGGESDGERVLDVLSVHPSTARFVCRKLVTYFVSDVPVDALVSRCASTFAAQAGAADQMAQVLTVILGSQEFLGTSYRSAKVKTPLEFAIGAVRQLGGEAAGDDISIEIQRLGMTPFMYASPAGYPDVGSKWVSTSMMQSRARFADRLLSYAPAATQTQFNLAPRMAEEGYETAEGVAGRMLERLLGPNFARRHRQLALDVLTEEGSYPYFHGAPDNEQRLRRLGKALLNVSDYHLQ